MSDKETDRHIDSPMVVYPMRIEVESLQQIRKLARKLDRTNQYMLREAVRYYLARKGKA